MFPCFNFLLYDYFGASPLIAVPAHLPGSNIQPIYKFLEKSGDSGFPGQANEKMGTMNRRL
jgi:hypothetical protein